MNLCSVDCVFLKNKLYGEFLQVRVLRNSSISGSIQLVKANPLNTVKMILIDLSVFFSLAECQL
eukprot:snap_masked-scaffold_3-processed-gene-5.28-mRNA-1 protein AED:1.00 eAED:1.00 QI:0/0/0/0/1/1/2/0/63